jgi:hypothetical protein
MRRPSSEHPILFAEPVVDALRTRDKTETRRLVLPASGQNPVEPDFLQGVIRWEDAGHGLWKAYSEDGYAGSVRCPYGVAGDRLWVRETHAFVDLETGYQAAHPLKSYKSPKKQLQVVYKSGLSDFEESLISRWRPSLFMPRWACRFTLNLKEVRVEKLRAITETGAQHEGVLPFFERFPCFSKEQTLSTGEMAADFPHRSSFAVLWDELVKEENGPLWKDNPWVWTLSFQRHVDPV